MPLYQLFSFRISSISGILAFSFLEEELQLFLGAEFYLQVQLPLQYNMDSYKHSVPYSE